MDPPTHGLLGAVIGQAFFARRLGRGALPLGAVIGMLPDVDIVMVPLLGGLAEWRYHRTATHSLVLLPLVALALGWLLWREHVSNGGAPDTRASWMLLALSTLLSHPLADAFTSYGTVLFWPWPRRFAWDAVAIVDLVFTGVLALALVLAFVWRSHPGRARAAAAAALALVAAYEAYGLRLNRRAEAAARQQAEALRAQPAEAHAYPVLLLPWLRRVVVRQGGEVAVGWTSTWAPAPILWHRLVPAQGVLVDAARGQEPMRMFEWFAMGQTGWTGGPRPRQVEIDDLRYGFPNDPGHGIWGLRARFDEAGRMIGGVEMVRRARPPARPLLAWLWRATFRGEIE